MMLSKTRSRAKRGTTRVRKHFQEHLDFIKAQPCACFLTHGFECRGQVVAAHYRTAGNAGTGTKPHSGFTAPLCDGHHKFQHQHGQRAFEKRYGLSMLAVCKRWAAVSPVPKVREFARGM